MSQIEIAELNKQLAKYGMKVLVGKFTLRDGKTVTHYLDIEDPEKMLLGAAKAFGGCLA